MSKERVIGAFTLVLGFYASWKASMLFPAIGAQEFGVLFQLNFANALFAFVGGMGLIFGKKLGYFFSLAAWSGELISGVSRNGGSDHSSYFIRISSIISIVVIGVLAYDIFRMFVRKNT